jgi:membrane protein
MQSANGDQGMRSYLIVLGRAVSSFFADNCTSFAAAISYYALFSLFPLMVFVLSIAGFFIHGQVQRESIVSAIFTFLGQGVDRNLLYTQVSSLEGGHGGLGVFSLVLSLWSASAVFGAARTGLNAAWNVTRSRPAGSTKLLDLAMVLAVGLLMLLSLAATGVLTAIQAFSGQILGSQLGALTHILFAALFVAIPPAISFVAFGLMYYVVPHAEIRIRDVWLGALVAAVLFQLTQIGFGFYVAKFANYDRIYGSLGAVIAFLFFMYISANILLFGGEVTKEHTEFLAGVSAAPAPAEDPSRPGLARRAAGMLKGLFIDHTPHHDTSMPYEPGREQPLNPGATMVRDDEARHLNDNGDAANHDGSPRQREP